MKRSRGNTLAIFIGAFVVLAAPLGSALVHLAIGHTRPDSIEEYSAAPALGTASADLFLGSGEHGLFLSPLRAAQVASNAAAQDVVINEFLAAPSATGAGDANGDGVGNATDDEFVELINTTGAALDISGYTISDFIQVRHIFANGTIVPAGEAVVVFGGGIPTGQFGNAAANANVFVASTGGLSLNNSGGETITVKNGAAVTVDSVTYSSSISNESSNRNLDITGATFVRHTLVTGAAGRTFSPGTKVDGTRFTTPPSITTFSPATVAPNSGTFSLTISGSNFDGTATAKVGGTSVSTVVNSSTELVVSVPNSLITAVSSTVAVQVVNGQGDRSNIVNLITGPRLDSISPSTVEVNSGALELTLNGQGFSAGAIVKVSGSDLTPSANTPTQLKATVPDSLLSSLGDLSVKVINSNGGPSIAKTLSVTTTPPPSVTGVDPSGIQRGSGDTAITVLGSAFKNGAVVRSDGVALQTSFADSAHVTATMTAAILAIAGPKAVSVTNPDNQSSGSVTLNVFLLPSVSALSPPIANKGGGDLLLTIAGSNFQDGVKAKFDAVELATSFLSTTEIRATVPAALVAAAGSHTVAARNPGSPDSNGLTLLVQEPAPSISSLAPASIVADSGDFTLTIHGSNFQSGAAVNFGGTVLTPTTANALQLTVTINNSLIQNAGSKSVFVKNPDGRVSAATSFSVLDRGTRIIVINEFLTDPPGSAASDLQGDANGDGSRSASQDEFIEIVNPGGAPVDISGWTLSDATTVRHTFAPGTIVPGGEAAVVFGGGTPTGAFGNAAQNGMIFKASGGSLSLGNSSDTIELKNATGQRIDIVVYTSTLGDNNQSANLNPDASGSSFALHSSVAGASGALFSPGTRVSGQPFTALPSLQRLDPDTIEAGSESFLLRVIGSGFSSSDAVTFSGVRVPTTFVDASQLLATVSGATRSIPGAHPVRVVTALGSRTSPLTFLIFVQPVIARLVPPTLFRGAGPSVLEVQGAGFGAGSRVQISALGGADAFSDLPSTFVSESALRATIDGSLLLETGLRAVRVVTPEARVSNQVFLSITLRPPVLDSVSPSRTFAGHPALSLLLTGSDFQPGAVVKFDSESLASSVPPGQDREMVAALPASFLVTDASHTVRVVNPDGQTSRSVPFVVSPLPVIDRIEPSSVRAGRRRASLTVLGSRFQADATVRVEGEEIVPASRSSSSIVVNLPEKFIRVPGRLSLKVVNGDGGESAEVEVLVVAPVLPAVIINEILADPPAGADVNGDGSASTSEDEFVEIVNTTNAPVSIGGYTISDATGIRHVFAVGTLLPAGESAIVFGGGNPTGPFGSAGNNGLVFKASTGTLSLNNTEETVTLRDAAGNLLSQVAYGSEGGNDQSLTLDPDVTGDLVQHTTSPDASGARFSPGTRVDGRPFTIAPLLQSITPGRIEVREEVTLTLSGQAFEPGARVMFGASVIDSEFVNSTELRFATTEETFPAEGSFQIRVMNPSGNKSNALLEEVVDLGPSISSVIPASAIAGSSPVEVTFAGKNFRATSRLQVDGVDHSLEVVNESAAKTTLTAPDLATPGRRELRVVNEDGRRSNRRFFDALIVIDSIVPERMLKSSDATITITGGGFRAGAEAMLDGTPLPTNRGSNTELRASIAASLIAVAGARSVIVRDANGTVSNAKMVRVHDTPPTLSSLNPPTIGAGASAFALTVTGSSFQSGAQVRSNGVPLPTTFVSSSQLSAQMPESAVARAGSLAISVENPDGGISSDFPLSISAQPLITRLSASSLSVGNSPVKLQLLGLTFQRGASVFVNDAPAETVYRRSTRVDVTIPGSLRGGPATLRLRVVNPDGGRSNVATIEVRE